MTSKHSFAKKLTSLGFILMILFGNFWFVDRVFALQPADWKIAGFYTGFTAVVLGGLGLAIDRLRSVLREPSS